MAAPRARRAASSGAPRPATLPAPVPAPSWPDPYQIARPCDPRPAPLGHHVALDLADPDRLADQPTRALVDPAHGSRLDVRHPHHAVGGRDVARAPGPEVDHAADLPLGLQVGADDRDLVRLDVVDHGPRDGAAADRGLD